MKLMPLAVAIAASIPFSILGQEGSTPNARPTFPSLGTNATTFPSNTLNASKRNDIIKLMKLTQTEEQCAILITQLIAQLKKSIPDVPESDWRVFEWEANPQELIALAVPIYEKHLTQEELKGLIAFYETPVGKKTLEKMALISSELMKVGQEWGERIAKRVEKQHSTATSTKAKPTPITSHRGGLVTPFTADEKVRILLSRGLDPEIYDIDDSTFDIVRKPEKPKKEPQPTIEDPRFLITVRNGNATQTYYSAKEPRQFGAGYKFRDIRGVDVTVSGTVEILKIQ